MLRQSVIRDIGLYIVAMSLFCMMSPLGAFADTDVPIKEEEADSEDTSSEIEKNSATQVNGTSDNDQPSGVPDLEQVDSEADTDSASDTESTESEDTDTDTPSTSKDTTGAVEESLSDTDGEAGALVDELPEGELSEAGEMELGDDLLDASLEELLNTPVEVWTATKTAENIEEAPSIIEVVTAEDFEMWGYETVGEALQHMLGFYIIDNHTLPNAAVRGVTGVSGSESGLIKVMIGGRSVAFRSTAGNWLGPELIPLGAVSRIEVIRGPASALYGADAFLATVNVVLKKPDEINGAILHGIVGMEENTFGTGEKMYPDSRYDLTAATTLGDVGIMLSFGTEQGARSGLKLPSSSPAPTIPDYNAGNTAVEGAHHESAVWYGQVSYGKDKGSVTLSAYGSTINRGVEFSPWAQLTSGRDYAGRKNGSSMKLLHQLYGLDGILNVSDQLTFTANFSFFSGKPLDGDRIEVASDLYYVRRQFAYRGFSYVLESFWKPLKQLSFVAGTEFVLDKETLPYHDRVDKSTGETMDDPDADGGSKTKRFINPAVYLQVNGTAVPDLLKLTGGIRFDYHDVYGSQVTGRAGTVFLWTRNFTTKLLYGSAFKAPSPYLLYGKPMAPGDVIGNPDLKPQFVHTLELAPALQIMRYLVLHSTLAYNFIRDKADYIPDGINRKAANVAEVQGLSWESKLDFNYEKIVTAYLGVEWQRVMRKLGREGYEAELIGNENVIAPPWIVRLGVSSALPFLKPVPLRIGVQSMIVAPRRASDENIVENGGSYKLPAYGMLNAFISFQHLQILPIGKTTIALRAYNLLDANGPDPGFAGVDYPLQRRRFMAVVSQTF